MTDVVLLHGWPGAASDFRRVVPLVPDSSRVLVPDLYGFGSAFGGPVDVGSASADAHAERVLALIRSEGLDRPIIAGYDIGSRVAQALARLAPDAVGGGADVPFPHLEHLVARSRAHGVCIVRGARGGLRSPGAFSASIAWYRDNFVLPPATLITVPTIMIWPEDDVLFDIAWADRLDDWFSDVSLEPVPECGHFVPLEAPRVFADAIIRLLDRTSH